MTDRFQKREIYKVILSRAHKYIFLHCRKAAGTSLKVALARHFGPRDICLGAWQEIMEEQRFPNRQYVLDALNWRGISAVCREFIATGRADYFWHMNKQAYRGVLGSASSHPSAARVKAAFPDEWNSYFKFTIVRNPFAVAVSSWRQRRSRRGPSYYSFEDFIRLWAESADPRQDELPARNWDVVAVDDRVELDLILRFETLDRDLIELEQRLGFKIDLPMVNADSSRSDYRDYYNAQTQKLAEDMFARELTEFGYRF